MVPAPAAFSYAPWVRPDEWTIVQGGRKGKKKQGQGVVCSGCGCKKNAPDDSHCYHCSVLLPRLAVGHPPAAQ
eukprot:5519501-Pyramimonas_sp.AAC.1